MLVWNVTPALQHLVLNSIHLCFSVATRSLAAFTDTHSWFYCAVCFVRSPQRLLLNKIVGGDGYDMCVFLSKNCSVHVPACLRGWIDMVMTMIEQCTVRVKACITH